jgi:hypothetical protein
MQQVCGEFTSSGQPGHLIPSKTQTVVTSRSIGRTASLYGDERTRFCTKGQRSFSSSLGPRLK